MDFTEDPDHVFTRGPFSVLDTHLVGNTVPAPAPKPFIWPSDHAGMVATLALGSCDGSGRGQQDCGG